MTPPIRTESCLTSLQTLRRQGRSSSRYYMSHRQRARQHQATCFSMSSLQGRCPTLRGTFPWRTNAPSIRSRCAQQSSWLGVGKRRIASWAYNHQVWVVKVRRHSSRDRKPKRKCSPSARLRSISFCRRLLNRKLGNPLQNIVENQISLVAPVVAKRIFVKIRLQVFPRHRVIDSADSPFNQRPESFDSLGVNVAQYVHASRMIDAAMRIAVSVVSEVNVRREIISEDRRFGKHMFPDDRHQSAFLPVGCNHSLDPSTTLDHAEHCGLVFLGLSFALSGSADSGFVHLNAKSLQLHLWLGEQRANLLKHAPRGLVRYARLALNLLRGNTTASRGHQVHGIEPTPQRCGGLMKDGSRHRGNLRSAVSAGIDRTASNPVVFSILLAFLAVRDAIWEAQLHQFIQTGPIIWESAVEVPNRKAQLFGNRLFNFHGTTTMAESVRDVKGYLRHTIHRSMCHTIHKNHTWCVRVEQAFRPAFVTAPDFAFAAEVT